MRQRIRELALIPASRIVNRDDAAPCSPVAVPQDPQGAPWPIAAMKDHLNAVYLLEWFGTQTHNLDRAAAALENGNAAEAERLADNVELAVERFAACPELTRRSLLIQADQVHRNVAWTRRQGRRAA